MNHLLLKVGNTVGYTKEEDEDTADLKRGYLNF